MSSKRADFREEIYFICDISVQQNDSSLFFDVTWQTQTRKPLKIEKGLQRIDLPAELLESDFFPETNLVGQKVYFCIRMCRFYVTCTRISVVCFLPAIFIVVSTIYIFIIRCN